MTLKKGVSRVSQTLALLSVVQNSRLLFQTLRQIRPKNWNQQIKQLTLITMLLLSIKSIASTESVLNKADNASQKIQKICDYLQVNDSHTVLSWKIACMWPHVISTLRSEFRSDVQKYPLTSIFQELLISSPRGDFLQVRDIYLSAIRYLELVELLNYVSSILNDVFHDPDWFFVHSEIFPIEERLQMDQIAEILSWFQSYSSSNQFLRYKFIINYWSQQNLSSDNNLKYFQVIYPETSKQQLSQLKTINQILNSLWFDGGNTNSLMSSKNTSAQILAEIDELLNPMKDQKDLFQIILKNESNLHLQRVEKDQCHLMLSFLQQLQEVSDKQCKAFFMSCKANQQISEPSFSTKLDKNILFPEFSTAFKSSDLPDFSFAERRKLKFFQRFMWTYDTIEVHRRSSKTTAQALQSTFGNYELYFRPSDFEKFKKIDTEGLAKLKLKGNEYDESKNNNY